MLTMHLVKNPDGTPQIPFKTVYVHGLVRDGQGQKMSKSKGNVLDPLDIVDGIDLDTLLQKRTSGMMQPKLAEKIAKQTRAEFPEGIASYGTDALRFTFCSLASTGRDIKFDMGRVEGFRNFCNKIWNAANFVIENTDGQDTGVNGEPVELSSVDRWIISQLQRTEQEVTRQLDAFRFDLAAQALYEFIWDEYCAWYLELVKPVLWDENAPIERQRGTRRTLIRVLETALRLAHPFMPFITEEIWQRIKGQAGKEGPTLMLQPWPVADEGRIDAAAEGDIEWVKALMLGVRQIRGEMNISMAKRIDIILRNASPSDHRRLADNEPLLMKLAKLESIRVLEAGEEAPMSATALVGDMEVLVPMAGLIDKSAELGAPGQGDPAPGRRGQARRRQAVQRRLRRQGPGRRDREGTRQARRGRTGPGQAGRATAEDRRALTPAPASQRRAFCFHSLRGIGTSLRKPQTSHTNRRRIGHSGTLSSRIPRKARRRPSTFQATWSPPQRKHWNSLLPCSARSASLSSVASSATASSRQTMGTCRRTPPSALEYSHCMLMVCSSATNAGIPAASRRARAICASRGWEKRPMVVSMSPPFGHGPTPTPYPDHPQR
ncbi:valyl-tRNA ligase [Pseudomonas aeruginosa]|nr:valyl-tRNA ligase [Pseudomonas aeruginosa]